MVEFRNSEVDKAYDELDNSMMVIVKKYSLNYFEILHLLAMMDMKVKQRNITGYVIEETTEWVKKLLKESEEGR